MNARTPLAACLLIAALASSPGTASATSEDFTALGLSNDDYKIMRAATATLYTDTATPPVVGDETIWINPESGSYGTTEVTGYDGKCVGLKILFQVGGHRENNDYNWRVCRQDDGRWLNAPD